MKKYLIAATSLCMLMINVAMADEIMPVASGHSGLKIGVIDVQTILQKSPQMEVAANQLKKQFKVRQDKIAEMQKSISDNQNKLKRDSTVLGKAELAKLQDTIGNQQRELRRMEEDYIQDAQAAQQKAMEVVLERVNEVVQKIADSGHYDLIIQKNTVAFASNKVNITDMVVKELKDKK